MNGGVYQVSLPRAEMPKEGGMEVPDAMGVIRANQAIDIANGAPVPTKTT